MKIGSIVIHCHHFDRTVAFWQAALHYAAREPAKDGWVVLRDPEDKGPNLSFQGRDRRPRSRSWLHLDLYTADQQALVKHYLRRAGSERVESFRLAECVEDERDPLIAVIERTRAA
jgi:hypothetical protein